MGQRSRWGLARVRGLSMAPALRPGDTLLVGYRRAPRAGDVVVARFPDATLAVKRIDSEHATASGARGWWLLSDNAAEGVDSRHRGAFPEDAVLGVVLLRVWPRPGPVRRT